MRNLIIILAAIILVACQNPAAPVDDADKTIAIPGPTDLPISHGPVPPASGDGTPIIKNAKWETIDARSLVALSRSAAGPSEDEIEAAVNEYNAETLDDFLRVYYGEAPDISQAPPVSVYIVHPVTYHVNMAQVNIPRSLLVENEAGWRQDAHGQLLFIDHIPPRPIPTSESNPYEWYAMYVIDSGGGIFYQSHGGYNELNQWVEGPEILAGGWRDADHYFETELGRWRLELQANAPQYVGWRIVYRQLYTSPEVTP